MPPELEGIVLSVTPYEGPRRPLRIKDPEWECVIDPCFEPNPFGIGLHYVWVRDPEGGKYVVVYGGMLEAESGEHIDVRVYYHKGFRRPVVAVTLLDGKTWRPLARVVLDAEELMKHGYYSPEFEAVVLSPEVERPLLRLLADAFGATDEAQLYDVLDGIEWLLGEVYRVARTPRRFTWILTQEFARRARERSRRSAAAATA